jgi:hypothetical protein
MSANTCAQRGRRVVAGFGWAVAKNRGTGRHAGGDAGHGVLDNRTTLRAHAQLRDGGQVHVGRRLAARHVVAAEGAAFEIGHEAAFGQLQLHLVQVGA